MDNRRGHGSPRRLRDRLVIGRATLRWQQARYWQARADLDEAARHADHALRLVDQHPSAPVGLIADIMLTLAEIARDRDEYAAWHELLRATVDLLELAPPTRERDRRLALALIGLGDAHRRAGRYREAETTLNHARGLIETVTPPEPTTLAALLTLLGIIAKELGAFDQAAYRYAEVGRIFDKHGATPAQAATLEHNRAGLAYAQQQYQYAEEHARRAIALRHDQTPRPNAVELAADLAVLGSILAGQHRYPEARACLHQAMAACQTAHPPRRYEIAVHLHGLAEIAHQEGHLDQADRLYRQSMDRKEQLLGPDHPEVGLVANNLATLLHDQHRDTDAARYYRRAVAIAEHHYPREHPVTAAIHANLDQLPPQP